MTGDTLCTGMRSMGTPSGGLLKVTPGSAALVAGVEVEAWGDEVSG
jgi:hypothetical protein